MEFLKGRRRFDVRPQAQKINRTFEPFRASSGRGFSVRRQHRLPRTVRLSLWTMGTLALLWSLALVSGQPAGPGQATAAVATETARW